MQTCAISSEFVRAMAARFVRMKTDNIFAFLIKRWTCHVGLKYIPICSLVLWKGFVIKCVVPRYIYIYVLEQGAYWFDIYSRYMSNLYLHMEDAECVESNEKLIFQILIYRVMGIFGHFCTPIFHEFSTITQKIGKLIFHSIS